MMEQAAIQKEKDDKMKKLIGENSDKVLPSNFVQLPDDQLWNMVDKI